jgi:hypothetical protein
MCYMICFNAWSVWNQVENFFESNPNPTDNQQVVDRLFVLTFVTVFLTGMATYLYSVYAYCWQLDNPIDEDKPDKENSVPKIKENGAVEVRVGGGEEDKKES